ncbi:CHAT domain-containing protein [Paraburkholderia caribensis]|uniref:CHAT domain-containing protein n=1 Tax=Paraburkholderia caribensis TaxID=75105 RepID=UPI001D0671E5|nr:CHAT domain-containing protein [Paraburkholderia caribensis]
MLATAKALRVRFDAQRGQLAELARNKLVLVVGEAKFTPDGYDESGDKGLVYLNAIDIGDGRVTLDNAMLPGVPTWRAPYDHGSLPKAEAAFEAYLELLRTGSTSRLTSVSETGASRGADALEKLLTTQYLRVRPSRVGMDVHPASGEPELMSPHYSDEPMPSNELAVSIKVFNGNVRFVEGPLLLGHYGPAVLTGPEIVMDKLLGGRLSKAIRVGRYPEAVGTQQIFINGCVNPHNPFISSQPAAVIVVGLGEEGKLGAEGLVRTVRQGVIAWCQRMEERPDGERELGFTATLLASGGMSVSPGDAAQGVVRGVCEANRLLAMTASPRVARLDLVDIYLDRATEAWLAVKALPPIPGARLDIDDFIAPGVGGLRRPLDSNYRSAGYDMISVTSRRDEYGRTCIVYAMDTRRARGELRPKSIQQCLLRKLVATSSVEQANNLQIGRTLFQLVVPFELRPHLSGKTDLVLSLDETTAGIPWELLQIPDDEDSSGVVPWSIRSKLLRKLQTVDYRSDVTDVQRDGDILIVGEPKVDLKRYPRLPGAITEAEQVYGIVRQNPEQISENRIKALIRGDAYPDGPDADTVINALFERNWRIVHIAGHGEAPEELAAADPKIPGSKSLRGKLRGVVLSDDVYLGPDEIEAVGAVPELVFVNCCHLAGGEINQVLDPDASPFDRPRFAATVAEMLIRIGVRCVIACGWSVDDEAASTFASTFYQQLFSGKRFIDAVGAARFESRKKGGNTWAAYQCYGNPDWTFRSQLAVTLPTPMPSDKLYAAVASPPSLVLALKHLSLAARYDESEPAQQVERIQYLEGHFRARYGEIGKVAEAFAEAWREVGFDELAESWYARAVQAKDGTALFDSGAEWARVRARIALKRFLNTPPANPGGAPDANVVSACMKEIVEAARLLETLSALRPSVKMETLTGSAWRRLANIERRTSQAGLISTNGIDNAVLHFLRAVEISKASRSDMLFLPALKYLSASTVQALWKFGDAPYVCRPEDRDSLISEIYFSLSRKMRRRSDFWSHAAFNGIKICDAVGKRQLSADMEAMLAFYEKLHAIASAPKFWLPVYRQAEFVLSNYQATSKDSVEREAASNLKERLRQWSGTSDGSAFAAAAG